MAVKLCGLSTSLSCINEFSIKNGDASALLAAIDALVYDGATDFSQLHTLTGSSTQYLFFTDGLSNYGEVARFPKNAVHTVVSTPVADFNKLKFISAATGGYFINLNQQAANLAVQQLTGSPYRFIGIKQNGSVKEINSSGPVITNGSLVVTGIAEAVPQQVVLQFGYDNVVDKEITIDISRENETADWAIEKFWAQQKADALEVFYENNKTAVADLGKKFGIVTKNSSLIVLEDVEDYVKYKITPPRDLLPEYNSIVKQRRGVQQAAWKDLLAQSKQTIKDLKAWWNTDYSKVPKYKTPRSPVIRADPPPPLVKGVPPPPPPSRPLATPPRENKVIDKREDADMLANAVVTRESAKSIAFTPPQTENEMVTIGNSPRGKIITVDIKSDAAYMKEIETAATPGEAYSIYLKLRDLYQTTPAFYFDVANWFYSKKESERATTILSNLAELELEDAELYKTIGYMLKKFGRHDKQLLLAKKVLDWRPMDPQSYRDYALALQDNGLYQNALDTLYAALTQTYTDETMTRDEGIEEVLLMEINNIVSLHRSRLNLSKIDKELLYDLPVDIRVALNWNMDNMDIDLHVTDPKGEECYYSQNTTTSGGRLSNDFTDGFGPEQFLLKKATRGKYKIETNFFGERRVTASGPATLMAEVYVSYASGKQERKIVVFQDAYANGAMADGKVLIGEFEF